MTIPGETERATIKVVPIYLDPVVEPVEAYVEPPASPAEEPAPDAPARRSGIVGGLALVSAMLTALLTFIGVAVASSGAYDAGTVLAWASIIASGVAVLGGLVALVFRLGRGMGVAAVILGIIANPWLLATLLGAIAPA